MDRLLKIGIVVFGSVAVVPSLAWAQTATETESAAEDPNDKAQHERTFEETRKHMQAHSEWSKKTGKMNDN